MSEQPHLHALIPSIKGIIFDIDGIFTDGKLHYTAEGETLKIFHVHDGLGIKLLLQSPIKVGVISGRKSPLLESRLKSLGIANYVLGASDKTPPYESMIAQWGLNDQEMAYMGDDLPDLPVMARVKLAITAANANPLIEAHADWQTQRPGGNGAVREVCDTFLQIHQCLSQCMEALGHGKLP